MSRIQMGWCILPLFLLAALAAEAQTTRADAIGEEQAKKATQVAPEAPNRAELLVNRYLGGVFQRDPSGFVPWLDSVFPGGGFSLGVSYQRHLPRGARAGGTVGYSIENYKMVEGRLSAPVLDRDRLTVDATARWTDAPSVAFYGLTPDSEPGDRTTYHYEPLRLAFLAASRPVPWLRFEGGYDFLDAPTSGDTPTLPGFSLEQTPGFNEDLSFGITRASAGIDLLRPSPGYNDRGGLYQVTWRRYQERDDRPYSYEETEVSLTQLVPLVGRYFVLAFRALGTFTDPDEGESVPFMLAPHVGSGSTVRGFRNRRFQDRHRVVLNGEYRWQPSRYLTMALFLDAGQVAPDVEALRWRELRTGYGIGARFHGPNFSVLRLELARSREGWKIVAGANQPF